MSNYRNSSISSISTISTSSVLSSSSTSSSDSGFGEGSIYEYYTPSDSNDEKGVSAIPEGFIHPQDDIYGVGDFLKEGQERACFITGIYSPSEIYVVLARHWPKKVDAFIEKMSRKYFEMARGPERYRWIAQADKIAPGMIVGVYKKDEKDWFRGRVLEQTQTLPETRFMVRLIDLGECHEFAVGDIVFLKQDFVDQVRFAIKCRLALSSFYDKFHAGATMWDDTVKRTMFSSLFDREVRVKFLRKVSQNGEMTWEVSLLEFKDEHPRYIERCPIEQQLIKLSTGSYIEESKGKEKVGPKN